MDGEAVGVWGGGGRRRVEGRNDEGGEVVGAWRMEGALRKMAEGEKEE